MPATPLNPMAVSSSLDSIFISPRTPVARSPRTNQNGNADDDVELSLLGEDERRLAAAGLDEDDPYTTKRPLSSKDKRAMVLLCVLCKFTISADALITVQPVSCQTLFKVYQ
jgi:PAT family acetyl-CoA transporter-like MFS transporter 1